MKINISKQSRAVIIVITALALITIGVSSYFYRKINRSNDPRVLQARIIYDEYNNKVKEGDFKGIFRLLDSVSSIFSSYPHYRNSFEIGVIENNRAAAYLSLLIYEDSLKQKKSLREFFLISQDSLVRLADTHIRFGIFLYEKWLGDFENLDKPEILDLIKKNFMTGLESYPEREKQRFLNKRVEEIQTAQYETKRRLSVAYTNLGILYRYRKEYLKAVEYYQKAIELWDKNLTAENNLNILLGRPVKKRNIIEKLFPASRTKSDKNN